MGTGRKKTEPKRVGNIMLSQIIGQKPRIPQTYAMRKVRNEPKDIEFCDNVDRRRKEWEDKADVIRKQQSEERAENTRLANEFVVQEVPPIKLTPQQIYTDFKAVYKMLNKNKKPFQEKNPYSNTNEPLNYVFTLIYYFMRDDRFFKSPLLRKDLSEPSFEKGTLSIGGYGCGKTSTWNTLLYCFRSFTKHVEKTKPLNEIDLKNQYTINKCVSSIVVDAYDLSKSKTETENIMRPLMSLRQLYIDDIMREKDASNFGKNNIFLGVLTTRADRDLITHLSMNYSEYLQNGETRFKDAENSLKDIRTRYDGRVHDRLFGNYNIIELTGKSFRR